LQLAAALDWCKAKTRGRLFVSNDRALSAAAGLSAAELPASACLSSRVPYGMEVTPEKLAQIDRAEDALRALGYRQLRVRHHGDLARVELARDEMARAIRPEALREISKARRGLPLGVARRRRLPHRLRERGAGSSRRLVKPGGLPRARPSSRDGRRAHASRSRSRASSRARDPSRLARRRRARAQDQRVRSRRSSVAARRIEGIASRRASGSRARLAEAAVRIRAPPVDGGLRASRSRPRAGGAARAREPV
jgi:hypothetical protein